METYSTLLVRRDTKDSPPQIFMEPGPSGWRLPVFVPQQDIYNTDIQTANTLVDQQLGIAVVTLQALRLPEPTIGGPLNIYVMEMRLTDDSQNSQAPLRDGKWFGQEALREVEFALPKERAVLTAWLKEAQGENLPSLRLPWWQEGWFEETALNLKNHALELGRTILAPVEQVRSASTSALLRVLTEQGFLYLKAVAPPFALKEVALTMKLAERDPLHLPVVLAAERDRLLLADFGKHRPLGSEIALEQWEEIIRFYAQLQTSSVSSVPEWLSLGCADLRTNHIATHLEELIAQVPERLHGLSQQLSIEELAQLRTLVNPLRDMCRELSDYGIPDALEHRDLHAGNVAVHEGGFLIYDWSHACVTYPFYGFGSLFLDDDWFPQQPELVSDLRDAYLDTWTQYAPLPRLQAAFELWGRLRPLFLAAHQSHVVASYQERLGGESNSYVAETATGNALQYMQWWLSNHWRNLLK
ncbi:aminoglycoside phosphotransferase family protein [Armatimonas rosea]|uniref:Aminoglycoside phosphotransferase domain-containing protein n=1 Tax=Armatimonas rosea TaxID=685828 RepID=A0A7W9SY19_ARMRO|nr:aminoglycoside phosphotransferase family protein [Armatimonas rosea]MBB6054013.1 hypothetical protein [Armatimonas rosea]